MANIGFIGCGCIAELHARAYANYDKARLYAVCDAEEDKAESRRKQWGAEKAYSRYQDMLEYPNISAVEILTPYDTHEAIAIAAAQAGKHIACQKPMTLNLASARRIKDAVDKAGVKFQLTEIYAHYPPIVRAKQLIDAGAIGEPAGMRFDYVASPRGGWDVPPSTYQQQTRIAGLGYGLETFDHGHHEWATVWYLLGDVARVCAWIDSTDGVLDTPATVMWKHKGNKRYGACDFLFADDLPIPTRYYSNDELYHIVGSRGILQINRGTGDLMDAPPVSLFDGRQWTHFGDMETDWGQAFVNAGRHFVDVVTEGVKASLTFDEGYEVLRFALAVMESARRRREVYLDELEHPFPSIVNLLRRRRERKSCIVAPRTPRFGWLGGDTDKYAPQAEPLTASLIDRFDGSAVPDWQCVISLTLTGLPGNGTRRYVFHFDCGRLTVGTDASPEKTDLSVEIDAGLWAAILLKKKRIEMAILQGKIKYEGRAEEGLYLKKAFHF